MPRRNTVTSATYADLLKNHLHPAIKSKRRGRLSTCVCLLNCCNNPRSVLRMFPHPPYSPDLAPSDFHVFGLLKQAMGGKSFRTDDEVQQAVQEWLRFQPKDFFFLDVSMHFRSAGTLIWNAMETTQKNEVIVYLWFSINY